MYTIVLGSFRPASLSPYCIVVQSYHNKMEVCISYRKYAPSDISGCNRATGSIMKYTLPFLLCILIIRLVATSSYHPPDL